MKSCLATHRVHITRITEVHRNPTTSRRGVTFGLLPPTEIVDAPVEILVGTTERLRNASCKNHHVRLFSTHMPTVRCPIHKIPLVCPACRAAKAGSVTSDQKAAASRENGKLGGRPKGSRKKKGAE